MEDELFDLTTMAMEYFKENIEPTLPEITYFGADFLDFTTSFASKSRGIFFTKKKFKVLHRGAGNLKKTRPKKLVK